MKNTEDKFVNSLIEVANELKKINDIRGLIFIVIKNDIT
jgi:hypothetical protein